MTLPCLAKLRRLFLGIAAAIALWQCAIQVDDPVSNVKEKIAKPIALTDSLLLGQWSADSTYALRDSRAEGFTRGKLVLWLYRDGRFRIEDSMQTVFPRLWRGRYARQGDSLKLRPDGESTGTDHVFLIEITFSGNYLRIYQPSSSRFTHFHRLPQIDTSDSPAFLGRGLWTRMASRDSADNWTHENLRSRFEYLIFRDKSFLHETWNRGIPRKDSGVFTVNGDTLALSSTPSRSYVMEALRSDTLRLWPLNRGALDSGFILFQRRDSLPKFHRDLSLWPGYWRGDSARDSMGRHLRRFESFYDFDVKPEGILATLAGGASQPRFTAWNLDSGLIVLSGSGLKTYRMRFEFITVATAQPAKDTLVYLLSQLSGANSEDLKLYHTRRNGENFGLDSIARFPEQSHARIVSGDDTLRLLSWASWSATQPGKAEFAARRGGDTAWLTLALPSQGTFSSDEKDFFFRVRWQNRALGHFTCSSRPDLPLTLRLQTSPAKTQKASLQGKCRVDSSEITAADTTMDWDGHYFIHTATEGGLISPLWKGP